MNGNLKVLNAGYFRLLGKLPSTGLALALALAHYWLRTGKNSSIISEAPESCKLLSNILTVTLRYHQMIPT